MWSSRKLLLYGLCFILQCCPVRGIVYVPEKTKDFPQCDPTLNQCPAHSSCEKANIGNYCACADKFYNEKDKAYIVYPGGECLEICGKKQHTTPCACPRNGFIAKQNDKGFYECIDVSSPTKQSNLLCPIGQLPPNTTNCKNHICPEDQPYNVSFPCIPGYKKASDGECVDINECREGKHLCDAHTECRNIPSGYYCECKKGFQRGNLTQFCSSGVRKLNKCTDINECREGKHLCDAHTECRNILSGYYCECKKGFQRGNLTQFCPSGVRKLNKCTDINECENSPGICESNFICRNTPGSYNCACDIGFTNISNTCIDICGKKQHTTPCGCPRNGFIAKENDKGFYECTVYDRCHSTSSTEQEIENCEKHNLTDPLCTFLKSIENITENACEGNKTNTSVDKVANQITNLLNQTSLKTLNSSELQTLVIAVIKKVETSLLASFATDPKDQQIDTAEIKADMKVSDKHCDKGSSIILEVDKNNMQVPCSLVNFTGGGAMFISYKGLNTRLNGSILAAFGDSDNRTREEMISPVVGGAITSDNTQNLGSPVRFTLKHLTALKPNYTARCVFWDSKIWSTQGCETQQSEQENSTICLCTHLSTIAVLMAPTPIEGI